MPDDEEIRQNLFDVKNSIAQQRLEGLTPSREVATILNAQRAAKSPCARLSPTLARGTGMQKYAGNDHYLDPEIGVLKNKLGIHDPIILEERNTKRGAFFLHFSCKPRHAS